MDSFVYRLRPVREIEGGAITSKNDVSRLAQPKAHTYTDVLRFASESKSQFQYQMISVSFLCTELNIISYE